MNYLLYLISFLVINEVIALDPCEKKTSCGDCITDSNICVWCSMNNITGKRCKSMNLYTKTWCPTLVEIPKNVMELPRTDNKNFSSDPNEVIQIRPQKLKMKLRVGVPMSFNFSFKAADDYPVDLYFLLDVSLTMTDVKKEIANQSENIYITLKNLTKNVHLGMGAFVDKNALPFTQKVNSNVTYSFRNHLKLTNASEKFREIVKNVPFGENFDAPEGGLDALAQVLSCTDEIGWRKQSRKIIVLLTDAEYHAAGDGIAAGIYKPYDGKCYTKDGLYTKELDMDYPSISIINKLATKIEATIIFIIYSDSHLKTYKALSAAIEGSKSILETKSKSNEVVKILETIYEEICKTVKLKANMKSEQRKDIAITFNPDCTGLTKDKEYCKVMKGEEKHFTGTIKLMEYHEGDDMPIDIVIEGINERLLLDIEVVKQCECENGREINSKECNEGGTLECGICKCNSNRYGVNCVCTKNENNFANDTSTCIPNDDPSGTICSGRGSCICGTCHCSTFGNNDKKYTGTYCECDNESCLRTSNGICNGHGVCECGNCTCHADWTGAACDCHETNVACTNNDKLCNDQGECVCNECKCRKPPHWDARKDLNEFCEILPCADCPTQCSLLEECVLCLHQHFDALSLDSCPICDPFKITFIEKLSETKEYKENVTWNDCPEISVGFGCYTPYHYRYIGIDDIELLVQKEKNCLENYYLLGGTFLGTLILVGIITLVSWKLLIDARDRREYKNFMRLERLSSIRNNPLYAGPTTTIKNPTYDCD
ncbi:integrin beta pat-3-like [Galleria mellonella]|uniref:Integrin beta n=1 Tax=Galleria mellonella TaxID=7137 RepID=A0A6J1WP25_GALME|nr:integrin beta pat-3-like [Galleria mellonella]